MLSFSSYDQFKAITRNTCMQQPLAYISKTLFQHEVFVITPILNAGSRCSRHIRIGNTNLQKIDETWTLFSTELSIYKIYKVGTLFCFLWALFNVRKIQNEILRKTFLNVNWN